MSRHRPRKGIELFREDDAYLVVVDLADYDPADVDCRWIDRRLTVHAERTTADGERTSVHRTIGLPRPVREDDVTASMADGVLEVSLPIADGPVDGRTVPITVE